MSVSNSSIAGVVSSVSWNNPLPAFMLLMLVTGTLNTLLMKFMVMQRVPTGPGGAPGVFDHPYLQSLLMMIGEVLCLIVFYCTKKPQEGGSPQAPKRIFMVACLLDWSATTLVNMAYMVVMASVVQMTRGAIVIFTCLFSVVFLGRRQYKYHMMGVFLVFVGITLVSLSTFMGSGQGSEDTDTTKGRMFGIMLCITAQVFQASMLVYEEKIMSQYTVPPLQVVGMEGLFGCIFGVVLLAFLNAFKVESTPVAVYQITHSTPLLVAAVGSIFSIAFFNFAGVTVTQKASAVARSTIDVSRTVLIWSVELVVGWNQFSGLQFAGFVVLATGTLIYNRLLVFQALEPPEEAEPILKSAKLPDAIVEKASRV